MNAFQNFASDLFLNRHQTLRNFSSWIKNEYPEVHHHNPLTLNLNSIHKYKYETSLQPFLHEIVTEVLFLNPKNKEELRYCFDILKGIMRVLKDMDLSKCSLTYYKILDFTKPLYQSKIPFTSEEKTELQETETGSKVQFFCVHDERWKPGVLVEGFTNHNMLHIKADDFYQKSFLIHKDFVRNRYERPFLIWGIEQMVDFRKANQQWCLCYVYHEDHDVVFLKEYISDLNVGWVYKHSSDLKEAGTWRKWLQPGDKVDCFSLKQRWGLGTVSHVLDTCVSVIHDYDQQRQEVQIDSYHLSRPGSWKFLYNVHLSLYLDQMKGDPERFFTVPRNVPVENKVMFHLAVEPKPWFLLTNELKEEESQDMTKHFANMVEYFFQINSLQSIFGFLSKSDNLIHINFWVKILSSLGPVLSYPFACTFIPKFNSFIFQHLYRLSFHQDVVSHMDMILMDLKKLNAKMDPLEGYVCFKNSFHEQAHKSVFDIIMIQYCPSLIKDVKNIIFSYWIMEWWLWDTWNCFACSYQNELQTNHCSLCGRKKLLGMSAEEQSFYVAALQQTDCEI